MNWFLCYTLLFLPLSRPLVLSSWLLLFLYLSFPQSLPPSSHLPPPSPPLPPQICLYLTLHRSFFSHALQSCWLYKSWAVGFIFNLVLSGRMLGKLGPFPFLSQRFIFLINLKLHSADPISRRRKENAVSVRRVFFTRRRGETWLWHDILPLVWHLARHICGMNRLWVPVWKAEWICGWCVCSVMTEQISF